MTGERVVLVAGGAGFVGSAVVRRLLGAGYGVRVLDDLSTGSLRNLPSGVRAEFVRGDIRDEEVVRRAVAGVWGISHQAALASVPESWADPGRVHSVNVLGTEVLLAAAEQAGVRRFVFASSSSVYGNRSDACDEGDPVHPLSPYAVSKWEAERRVLAAGGVALRYFNVYGPGQRACVGYPAVVAAFAEAISAGRPPVIYGDGNQIRDFVYVDDVAAANVLALEHSGRAGGMSINAATGHSVSVLAMLEALATGFEVSTSSPEFRPGRVGDVQTSRAARVRAREVLDWCPEVSLRRGARQTALWWRRCGGAESLAVGAAARMLVT